MKEVLLRQLVELESQIFKYQRTCGSKAIALLFDTLAEMVKGGDAYRVKTYMQSMQERLKKEIEAEKPAKRETK
jgi:hypothetical protein